MSQLNRITIDPETPSPRGGKPCIRGMRWPIEVIIDLLSSGMSSEEILEDHLELEKKYILASLEFARIVISGRSIKEVA